MSICTLIFSSAGTTLQYVVEQSRRVGLPSQSDSRVEFEFYLTHGGLSRGEAFAGLLGDGRLFRIALRASPFFSFILQEGVS